MSEGVQAISASVLDAIDKFRHGSIDLDDLQSRLQSAMELSENTQASAYSTIRLAEADLEEIRFTRRHDEQRQSTLSRMDLLRRDLAESSRRSDPA